MCICIMGESVTLPLSLFGQLLVNLSIQFVCFIHLFEMITLKRHVDLYYI